MQTARIAGYWAWQYNIPIVRLTGAALRDRSRRGICTHNDATQAWGVTGGHTDPGSGYPMDLFLERAQAWRDQFAGVPVVVHHNPYPAPTRLLYLYARQPYLNGDDVKFVQWALWGPTSAVDGLYGPVTESAVRAFQSRQGLVADGIVGPQTASRLATITH